MWSPGWLRAAVQSHDFSGPVPSSFTGAVPFTAPVEAERLHRVRAKQQALLRAHSSVTLAVSSLVPRELEPDVLVHTWEPAGDRLSEPGLQDSSGEGATPPHPGQMLPEEIQPSFQILPSGPLLSGIS